MITLKDVRCNVCEKLEEIESVGELYRKGWRMYYNEDYSVVKAICKKCRETIDESIIETITDNDIKKAKEFLSKYDIEQAKTK